MPQATTRIAISFALGGSMSSSLSCSDPPVASSTAAFVFFIDVFLLESSVGLSYGQLKFQVAELATPRTGGAMTITFAEIKARFEEERRAQKRPATADDLPFTYEAITGQWLTAVLARGIAGAVVESHALGPRDDGTSNRRRIELRWNDAGQAAGLPTT